MSTPVFGGTPEQQELAKEIFQIMSLQGSFFAANSPIRQSLTNLVDYLSTKRREDRQHIEQQIDAALQENSAVFQRVEDTDEIFYITSRSGSYQPVQEESRHSFKQRFYEPDNPLPLDDMSIIFSTNRPILTSVEPVLISDYWQEQAEYALPPDQLFSNEADEFDTTATDDSTEDLNLDGDLDTEDETLDLDATDYLEEEWVTQAKPVSIKDADALHDVSPEMHAVVTHAPKEPLEAVVADAQSYNVQGATGVDQRPAQDQGQDGEQELEAATEADDLIADEEVAEIAEVVVEVEEEYVVDERLVLSMPDGTAIDLGRPIPHLLQEHGALLRNTLIERLEEDPLRRIVSFGRYFYPESGIVSMGKNDLRRIRDYIIEVGEPLLDTAIIADLYYHNPRHADYEGFRFSLNYRLSREKDFEFVGVEGARLWSTKGLTITKTKRVKISEMGQLTNFLTETYDESLNPQLETTIEDIETIEKTGQLTRLLTFFEWEYGILPLDKSLETLFPSPMLPEQRSAVLRIESPQHYLNFLVELRYPTGNRGGWLQGFEAFFHEHLVAGAFISLARTDEPNVFTLTYEEIPVMSERLLTLDEKKNKFAFSTIELYCFVDEDQLLAQRRFGKLKNLKSLPMAERRKADVVLKHIFETVGDQTGSRDEPIYRIKMQDLYLAFNILRPASIPYLRSLIDEEDNFSVDVNNPDTYCYKPEPEPMDEPEEEEPEELEFTGGGRRWTYGDDDDDE